MSFRFRFRGDGFFKKFIKYNLDEKIRREANKEDDYIGCFGKQHFKSEALLDEGAK